MVLAFTPGVKFLFSTVIPSVLGPPLFCHALLIVLSQIWLPLSTTPLVCTYLFSLPAYLFFSDRIARLKEVVAARRLDARVVPCVEGLLPGNIDLLYLGLSADRTDYLGEPWIPATKKHGTTFGIKILRDYRLCTLNPRNIQKILATEFDQYRKGKLLNGIMEPMLGVGVFNSDAEMWQFHRKMTRPFFSKERVTDLLLYDRKAGTTLQKMHDRFDAGLAIDFQDLISRFTLDSASEFLLGASINSLDAPLAVPNSTARNVITDTANTRFSLAFAAAQVTLLRRIEMGTLWPLSEIFADAMKEPMVEIKKFLDPIVRNAMSRRQQGGQKDEKTLLGHLVDVTDDIKVIVDETLSILLAGRDTTASLLTFVTYCLAMYPEVLFRLRQEIISTIGSTRAPSYEDIREMKYLRAVLNETLRLFPPVPFNLRETIGETIWFDDEGKRLYVPPNTRLGFSILHLHRSEDYWGPDAHIYDPDRWLDARIHHYTSNPFIFVPFNAGPRICLGQQFAYHETSYFLVRMLQQFDHIELAPECQPPKTRPPQSWKDPVTSDLAKRKALEQCFPRSHLTLYTDGGLWIRARQAENA